MKQLIVAAAMLPVLIAFFLQFMLIQANHSKAIRFEDALHDARIEAGMSGGFTESAKDALRLTAAEIYGVAVETVRLELDMAVTGPHSVIRYRIGIPCGPLVAANGLFGIADGENQGFVVFEGQTAAAPVCSPRDFPEIEAPVGLSGSSKAATLMVPYASAAVYSS